MITITHTRPEGTIVEGTARGDGSAPILKTAGFRWAPGIRAWIIQQSRDRAAKTWRIDQAAKQLRAAGFQVEVSIDETPRAFAEAEAEREARAEQRADTYADRAERAESAAAAAFQRFHDILEPIPPGQPILIGHHSERGHRAALKRADNAIRRSIEEDGKASHYQQAAATSERYKQRRESLGTTLRRIERLEAEQRDIARKLQGYQRQYRNGRGEVAYVEDHEAATGQWAEQLQAQQQQNADELEHWRQVVAAKQASGAKVWGPGDFAKGDEVLDRWNRWRPVLRVNPKSLTVPSGYTWNDKIPYPEVRGRREASIPPTVQGA
ncbi:MAG TPA: DUF3560 domain-containing protein [Actinomycetes bacterium]|jgi:pyridoxine 5'-phosphate synthase PdxJ|nr:DUF3560 domain-containing protein [Actinomycetes bacterium]